MDPVSQSAVRAVAEYGVSVDAIRRFRRYIFQGLTETQLQQVCDKVLANESIEPSGRRAVANGSVGSGVRLSFQKCHRSTAPVKPASNSRR